MLTCVAALPGTDVAQNHLIGLIPYQKEGATLSFQKSHHLWLGLGMQYIQAIFGCFNDQFQEKSSSVVV